MKSSSTDTEVNYRIKIYIVLLHKMHISYTSFQKIFQLELASMGESGTDKSKDYKGQSRGFELQRPYANSILMCFHNETTNETE